MLYEVITDEPDAQRVVGADRAPTEAEVLGRAAADAMRQQPYWLVNR